MKTIFKTTVLFAALMCSLTSCKEDQTEKLISELEKTKPEFVSLDSSLTGIKNFLLMKKDSLIGISEQDPKRKTEIDSLIKLGEKDMLQFDSVAISHADLTKRIDSLKNDLTDEKKSVEDANKDWSSMLESHKKATEYRNNTNMAILFIAMADTKKDSVVREEPPRIKGK